MEATTVFSDDQNMLSGEILHILELEGFFVIITWVEFSSLVSFLFVHFCDFQRG